MKSTLRQIHIIGVNFFLETIRSRMFSGLVLSGAMMYAGAYVLGLMSVDSGDRTALAAGFWILGTWGLIASVALGVNVIDREIKLKTLYMILSRPVSRTVLVAGKFFGMQIVMAALFFILSLVFLIVLFFSHVQLTPIHWVAIGFIFFEWMVLSGFSLLFACVTSPLLQAFFVTAIFYMGHWSGYLKIFSQNLQSPVIKKILLWGYYILPNLELLNFREAALNNAAIIVAATGYQAVLVALGWTLSVFFLAIIFFRRKKAI